MELCGEVLKVQVVMERLEGDLELYNELLRLYLKELPRLCNELQVALDSKVLANIASTAHALKGASDNLGAEKMGNFCRHLESICRSGSNDFSVSDYTDFLNQLRTELEQTALC